MNQPDPWPYLESLKPGLIPIPRIQPGVCPICRAGVEQGSEVCTRCEECRHSHTFRVLPISISIHRKTLHKHLRWYKDGDSFETKQFTRRLAALLKLFLQYHLIPCLGGPVDLVATVPSSSKDRDAPRAILNQIRQFKDGSNPLERKIDADDFTLVANPRVAGQRVLLLDDTFTRGKSIFEAYRALDEAGAHIVGPLVIGRHFHSDWPPNAELLKCLEKVPWSVEACGICQPVDCPELRPSPTLALS